MVGKLSKQRLTAAEKQAEAMRLRIAGRSFDAIAEALGYASKSGAYKAVLTGLQNTLQEPADELRTLEVERLDAMIDAIWDKVESGSEAAIDRALRIMERRSRLLGLDQPARVDVTSGGERLTLHWPEYEGEVDASDDD